MDKENVQTEKELSHLEEEKPLVGGGGLIRHKSEIPIHLLMLSFLISIVFGGLSGWYFNRGGEKEIVVLDVQKIVDAKKKEFVEKYKDREASPGLKKEMEADIEVFTNNLNKVIQEQSKGRIVLLKDSVVSETWDITDEVEKKINRVN